MTQERPDADGISFTDATPNDVPRLLTMGDAAKLAQADALSAYESAQSGTPRGPLSGIKALDWDLGGCLSVGLHVAHGEPGTGKTAFALQMAASCGCAALFVTTEMAVAELFRRHIARVTEVFLGRLKSGELAPEVFARRAQKAAAAAPMLAFLDATRCYAQPAQIKACAQTWRERCGSAHLLVVVDSLHTWAGGAPLTIEAATEYERLSAAVATLQRLALELNAAVLAVSERNRAQMESAGQSAGAGTRRIEYGSESVLALQRHKDDKTQWRPDAAGEYQIDLHLAKNRNGVTGTVIPLRFHGALQRFRQA